MLSGVLIGPCSPMVLAICRMVLPAQHDVEEAFQDTFLALARYAHTIKRNEKIGPWLYRVALRQARKARLEASLRRVGERNRTEFRPEHPIGPPDSSLIPLVRDEVIRLPENYGLPVVLCYPEAKTNEDASAQLRCPVGTTKGRLSRASQTLRDRLSRRGLNSYPGPPGATHRG